MAKTYSGGISIPTGFKLLDNSPIADYMVVDLLADLDTLANQFVGMTTFVIEDQTMYVKKDAGWEAVGVSMPQDLQSVLDVASEAEISTQFKVRTDNVILGSDNSFISTNNSRVLLYNPNQIFINGGDGGQILTSPENGLTINGNAGGVTINGYGGNIKLNGGGSGNFTVVGNGGLKVNSGVFINQNEAYMGVITDNTYPQSSYQNYIRIDGGGNNMIFQASTYSINGNPNFYGESNFYGDVNYYSAGIGATYYGSAQYHDDTTSLPNEKSFVHKGYLDRALADITTGGSLTTTDGITITASAPYELGLGDITPNSVSTGTVTITNIPTADSDAVRKDYVDGLVANSIREAGDWDASLNTFPTVGTGTGGAIRRGDTYRVTVAGNPFGGSESLDVGDSFRALVNNPGQTSTNWAKFEVNTAQATASYRGTMFLFNTTGSATNGTMTQNSITTALNLKANLSGGNTWSGTQTALSVVTQTQGNNSTLAASTAYVDTGLATKFDKSGGTLTGSFNSQSIFPFSPNVYTIGNLTNYYTNINAVNTRTSILQPLFTASTLNFRNYSGGTTGYIFSTGNWNIGTSTTDSGYKLQVEGTAKFTGRVTGVDAVNNNEYVTLSQADNLVKKYYYNTISSNTTLTGSEYGTNGEYVLYVNTSTGNVQVRLPSASNSAGKTLTIIKTTSDSNSVIVLPSGTETLNGGSTYSITTQYKHHQVKSDSSQLFISI